jgi:hypothetical protein
MDENNENTREPREGAQYTEKAAEQPDNNDASHIEEAKVEKLRSESDSSGDSTLTENEDEQERPPLTHSNSVPASVMSHPMGGDLERGPTGPKNKAVDEEGKIVVNWESREDQENPKNWPRRKKIFNVVVISSMTFLCPLCSAMFVRCSSDEANAVTGSTTNRS